MATQEIPVTPHTLPAGYCFTTLQDLLDTFSAHQTVELPEGSVQIIVSESTPGAADQDKVWLKLDGTGDPVNFYWFNGGSWVEVNPPTVFWGIGSNVVDAYSVAVANPPAALVTGQLYLFKVTAANTGAATLAVNAFGTFAFNSAGVALVAGALVANSYVGAIWTGTTFELMGGISTVAVSRLIPGSETQRITTTGGVAVWQGGYKTLILSAVPSVTGVVSMGAHGLSASPQMAIGWLRCVTSNNGFNTGDKVILESLGNDGNALGVPPLNILVTSTTVSVQANYQVPGFLVVKDGSSGAIVNIWGALGQWEVVAELYLF